MRGIGQGLGAFDAKVLDTAERADFEVRAEMPQQAALAGAAMCGEPRRADLVAQLPVEEVRDFFRGRVTRFFQPRLFVTKTTFATAGSR